MQYHPILLDALLKDIIVPNLTIGLTFSSTFLVSTSVDNIRYIIM